MKDLRFNTEKRVEAQRRTLAARGAELLAPTNPYELIRFRTIYGVGVVYRNADNTRHSLSPAAESAFARLAEDAGASLSPTPVRRRNKGHTKRRRALTAIFERDGPECFYCACHLAIDVPPDHPSAATQEHLVPVNVGGPNHLSNKFAACKPCNAEAGHLSAVEKIRLRDRKRGHLALPAPSSAPTPVEGVAA